MALSDSQTPETIMDSLHSAKLHESNSERKTYRYDSFISYSHVADARLAAALEKHLEKFAKPWYRRQAANVFRDETSLTANPHLWANISLNLDSSAYLIFLASTAAAESKWVQKELCYWISGGVCDDPDKFQATHIQPDRVQRILLVHTEGEIIWNDSVPGQGDFDWSKTTAVPKVLSAVFAGEPFWLDLRWTRKNHERKLDRTNDEFMQAIAKLSSPMRNLEIESLIGIDYREHRRTIKVFLSLSVGLAIAFILACLAAWIANDQRALAHTESNRAWNELSNTNWTQAIYERDERKHSIKAGWHLLAAAEAADRASDKRFSASALIAFKYNPEAPIASYVHDAAISDATLLDGGNALLISSYSDNIVRLWNLQSQEPLRDWKIGFSAFSHDKSKVLTWDTPGVLQLRDVASWHLLRMWKIVGTVKTAFLNQEATSAFTLDDTGNGHLWDVSSDVPRCVWKIGKPVTGVCFNKASTRVLTWSNASDNVFLLDIASTKPIRSWTNNSSFIAGPHVSGAMFNKNESQVLTWNLDWIFLFDVSIEQPLNYWSNGEFGSIQGAAFNNDGSRILCWGSSEANKGTLRLLDPLTKSARIWDYGTVIKGARFIREESSVLAWSTDDIRLWNVSSASPSQVWKHENVTGVVCNKSENLVLSWSYEGDIRMWAIDSDQMIRNWKHDVGLQGGRFSKDSSSVLTWGSDGSARLWATTLAKSPSYAHSKLWHVRFNHDRSRILTNSADQNVRLWDTHSKQTLRQWKHDRPVQFTTFVSESSSAFTWEVDTSRLWIESSQKPTIVQKHERAKLTRFDPMGNYILTTEDNTVCLWKMQTNKIVRKWSHESIVIGAYYNDQWNSFLTNTVNGKITMWNMSSEQPAYTWDISRRVDGAAFNNDGTMVLTWGNDGVVQLWRIGVEAPFRVYVHDIDPYNGKSVSNAVFSKDESNILTWGSAGATLWDVASGRKLRIFKHDFSRRTVSSGVTHAVFNDDGSQLVTLGEDQTARLWITSSDTPLQVWKHTEPVQGAVIASTGSHILTWSGDVVGPGGIWLWDTSKRSPLVHWKLSSPARGAIFEGSVTGIWAWSTDGVMHLDSFACKPAEYSDDWWKRQRLINEVRTATMIDDKGQYRVLTFKEWETTRTKLK